MQAHFTIGAVTQGNGVLTLTGEFDVDARPALTDAVLTVVRDRSAGSVTLDLAATTFLDSEAMAAIITGMNAAREIGKPFHLVNATGTVRRVLDIAGLLDLTEDDNLA